MRGGLQKVKDSTEGYPQVNIKHVRGPDKFILKQGRRVQIPPVWWAFSKSFLDGLV